MDFTICYQPATVRYFTVVNNLLCDFMSLQHACVFVVFIVWKGVDILYLCWTVNFFKLFCGFFYTKLVVFGHILVRKMWVVWTQENEETEL